jgi:hypothetical protein
MAGKQKKWIKLLIVGIPAAGVAALSAMAPQIWMQQLLMFFVLLWFNVVLIVDLN